MLRTTRSLIIVSLLVVVALLAAACGSSGSSSNPQAPEPTATLVPVPADVLARQQAQYVGPIGELRTQGETLERPVNAEGITQAVDLTGGSPPCPGWVGTYPDYIFDVKADLANLRLDFVGAELSTLMVVTPAGRDIFCTGVNAPEISLTPSIDIPQPEQGRYMVYVGRGNLSGATLGKLTVTGQ